MNMLTGHKLLMKIRQELKRADVLEWKTYHPVVELAKIGADPKVPPAVRFAANQTVAQFVTPKPAAVDFEGKAVAPQIQVLIAPYAAHNRTNGHTPRAIEDKSDEEA